LPTIDTNGVTLFYEALGNPADPPLLLVMGVGTQLTGWPDSFCQALVDQGFFVIRFDNRDIGLSSKLTQFGVPNLKTAIMKSLFRMKLKPAYTLNDMATDTVGLLDGLGIAKAHLVGASMGGMIAQIVAAEHPQRILSLTSIMSTSGRRGLPVAKKSVSKAMLTPARNPADMDEMVKRSVHILQMIGSPRYPVPVEATTERVIANMNRSMSPDGYARQMLAILAAGDRTSQLKSIHVPTLVIHGASDPLIPIACGRDTADLIPGATFRKIDGMGHNFPPQLDEMLTGMIATHCRAISQPVAAPA
jgi:proline iminopeptidase